MEKEIEIDRDKASKGHYRHVEFENNTFSLEERTFAGMWSRSNEPYNKFSTIVECRNYRDMLIRD